FCKHEQSPYFQKLAGTAFALPSYQVAPGWVQLGITTWYEDNVKWNHYKMQSIPCILGGSIPFLFIWITI
ncbi:MAG: hypothetical protein FWG02_11205, partial [Holophagaceae bacterium]|nr:hypothetical protein [Holophagaceae bacterium]